jgi:predicted transport protein
VSEQYRNSQKEVIDCRMKLQEEMLNTKLVADELSEKKSLLEDVRNVN